MNLQRLKKGVAAAVAAIALIISIGFVGNTAQAQYRRGGDWDRNRESRREAERRREWIRLQQRERAREIARERARERERNRNAYRYGTRRNYPAYGGYGNYGGYGYGGYSSAEEQRGFNNGFKEGKDDAEDRDSFNPSRHSSFRDGNPAYRSGFSRGYNQGYRQYSGYSRW
jgi:hypothetical protein